MSGRTWSRTVGSMSAPLRPPPASTRAPAWTASFTQSSARAASSALIMGPTSQSRSSGLPVFRPAAALSTFSVKGPAMDSWT